MRPISDFNDLDSNLLIQAEESSDESLYSVSENQEPSSSDAVCGEPLTSQHILIDFTPIDELDNDVVFKKCSSFWEFLRSRTDLHNLMVFPETKNYTDTRSSVGTPDSRANEDSMQETTSSKDATRGGCKCSFDNRPSSGSTEDVELMRSKMAECGTVCPSSVNTSGIRPTSNRCGLKR